ncbi:hypothetical protein C8R45DRAFT_943238 [Mycena sanguinolenta]|nr:hypothetical protein C8R45DRAFT_943238 [Mycena sanguinolenta]
MPPPTPVRDYGRPQRTRSRLAAIAPTNAKKKGEYSTINTINTTSVSTCSPFAARRPAKIRTDECELRNERRHASDSRPLGERSSLRSSHLSPDRVPVPLELAHTHEIAPAPARIRGPARTRTRLITDTSAYKTSRATARCVHGQHYAASRRGQVGRPSGDRSVTLRTGTALVKTSTPSVKTARAHDACSLRGGRCTGRVIRKSQTVLKFRTRTRAHDTRAGVQDVDGVAILHG